MNASDAAEQPSTPEWPVTDDDITAAMQQMLRDGSWGRYHGPHCARLRGDLSSAFGVEHVALCSSGTSAIELCLRGAGVGAGDEVILAAYDYKANFINVLTVGATPVLIDTVPSAPVPDVAGLSDAVTDRTRAVVVSHLHGCLSPMEQLRAVTAGRGVVLIEDVCQSPGAVVDGRAAGAWGDVAALSFGGSKLLTAGRGGAVLTNDPGIAQRIRLYTQRGNDAYPLSEMQAAVLVPQLAALSGRNRLRQERVDRLASRLGDSAGLRLQRAPLTDGSAPAYYKVAIEIADCGDRTQLEQLSAVIRKFGVAADPAFAALHLTHSARRFRAASELTNAGQLHHSLMTLHHPVLLHSDAEMDRVADVLLSAVAAV